MIKKNKTIGIFGGSFSPVHLGHLAAAQTMLEKLRLDELRFIPCARSAYGKKLLPGLLRVKLLKSAIKEKKKFKVDTREIRAGGISRTVDTLRDLRRQFPKQKFIFFLGADQLIHFGNWKEPSAIRELADIWVMTRPGFKVKKKIIKKWDMSHVEVPQYGISSREIRRRLGKGLDISWMVPQSVAKLLLNGQI